MLDMPNAQAPIIPPLSNVVSSSLAGLLARGATHPLDTFKVLQQTSKQDISALQLLKKCTIRGLYSGFGISLALSAPGLALYLTAYDSTKSCLSTRAPFIPNYIVHFLSAVAAEGAGCILLTPMEVIKQRQQISKPDCKNSYTMPIIRTIRKEHGLRGFWRGYGMTLLVFVPFSGAHFITYEKMKVLASRLRKKKLTVTDFAFCSAVGSTVGSLVANPMDIIKTRYQVMKGNDKSILCICKVLYQKEGGYMAFMKGVGARIAWTVPQVVIAMSSYEVFKNYFNK